ncbi:MAG: deoxyribonuclease IV [Candidatus Bipolaricaulia bacterium]
MSNMRLGCHLSIAGGVDKAVDAAEALDINALQIFSHSSRTWKMRDLAEGEAERFKKRRVEAGIEYGVIHTIYLINLASPNDELYRQSVEALEAEVRRAGELGIEAVNTHIGAHTGSGLEQGIEQVIAALNELTGNKPFEKYPEVRVLLENTAGAGTTIGSRFEEIARILERVVEPDRFGACFDTCHGFTSGYDIRTQEGVEAMVVAWDRTIGLERLELIHLNDSKHPFNSNKDRHEHIGDGYIGLEGFGYLINHAKLRDRPFILETPKQIGETDKLDSEADRINLDQVRKLMADR